MSTAACLKHYGSSARTGSQSMGSGSESGKSGFQPLHFLHETLIRMRKQKPGTVYERAFPHPADQKDSPRAYSGALFPGTGKIFHAAKIEQPVRGDCTADSDAPADPDRPQSPAAVLPELLHVSRTGENFACADSWWQCSGHLFSLQKKTTVPYRKGF
jgi:hypothetical protein